MRRRCAGSIAGIVAGMLVLADGAQAQLKGHYIPGFAGLQAGSQAPPGINAVMPVYFYTTNDLRNNEGVSFPGADTRVKSWFVGGGVAWVTNVKVLGANLGGSAIPLSFIEGRIEGPSLRVPGEFQFTDITVQPVQLGWHTTQADFIASYSFFAPTGAWELRGDNNSGLGMWSHDLQGGTTIYLDKAHDWSFAALGTYELHSNKRDTQIRVGDIFTIEGGLGRTFVKVKEAGGTPVPSLVVNAGLAYYGQWKVTADSDTLLADFLAERKDRVYGVGAEGTVILPGSGWVFGLRAVKEFGARNRTQGWTALLSVAYELKSLVRGPQHH